MLASGKKKAPLGAFPQFLPTWLLLGPGEFAQRRLVGRARDVLTIDDLSVFAVEIKGIAGQEPCNLGNSTPVAQLAGGALNQRLRLAERHQRLQLPSVNPLTYKVVHGGLSAAFPEALVVPG